MQDVREPVADRQEAIDWGGPGVRHALARAVARQAYERWSVEVGKAEPNVALVEAL